MWSEEEMGWEDEYDECDACDACDGAQPTAPIGCCSDIGGADDNSLVSDGGGHGACSSHGVESGYADVPGGPGGPGGGAHPPLFISADAEARDMSAEHPALEPLPSRRLEDAALEAALKRGDAALERAGALHTSMGGLRLHASELEGTMRAFVSGTAAHSAARDHRQLGVASPPRRTAADDGGSPGAHAAFARAAPSGASMSAASSPVRALERPASAPSSEPRPPSSGRGRLEPRSLDAQMNHLRSEMSGGVGGGFGGTLVGALGGTLDGLTQMDTCHRALRSSEGEVIALRGRLADAQQRLHARDLLAEGERARLARLEHETAQQAVRMRELELERLQASTRGAQMHRKLAEVEERLVASRDASAPGTPNSRNSRYSLSFV